MLVLVGVVTIAATAVAWLQFGRRRQPTDLGWMSAQWLAEQRANHSS